MGAREAPRMEDMGQRQPHPDCLGQRGKEVQGRWPHIHHSEPVTGPPWTSRPWPQCTEGTLAGAPPHRPSNPHNAGNSHHPLQDRNGAESKSPAQGHTTVHPEPGHTPAQTPLPFCSTLMGMLGSISLSRAWGLCSRQPLQPRAAEARGGRALPSSSRYRIQ